MIIVTTGRNHFFIRANIVMGLYGDLWVLW